MSGFSKRKTAAGSAGICSAFKRHLAGYDFVWAFDECVKRQEGRKKHFKMDTEKKTIAVVGLGLIGGSLAMALKGFEDYEIVGVARRQATVDYALAHGVGDRATVDAGAVLSVADVTYLCIDPGDIINYLKKYKDCFKPGSLVSDVCGIKGAIEEAARVLPENVEFIGSHPMAGTEFSGIEHAQADMFLHAHYIMTPSEKSSPEKVALIERIAAYIGCSDVVKTTPAEHDTNIAYTSQMMHIIALSVCDDEEIFRCKGFEGSSFRGCTRVADLDVDLWAELFCLNENALCERLDVLIDNLTSYRDVLEGGNMDELKEKLMVSKKRKQQLDTGVRPASPYYI